MFVQKKKGTSTGLKPKPASSRASNPSVNPLGSQSSQSPSGFYQPRGNFQGGSGSNWSGSRSSGGGNPILAVMPKTSSVLAKPTKPIQRNPAPSSFFGSGAIRNKAMSGARFNPLTRSGSPSTTGKTSGFSSNIPSRPNVALSEEQKKVLYLALDHHQSIFFTGSAGTGKSLLLQELIYQMKSKYKRDEVAVTASTGVAACNIGGSTIHSFSGVGIGQGPAESLLNVVLKNRFSTMRWTNTKVLIVDEISMLDGDFFDKLEFIARKIRKSNQPFGGIQIVATGDFFQLPPVSKESKFCFEAAQWKSVIQNTIHLTQVFRQRDKNFIKILNDLRVGVLTPESEAIFHSLKRVPQFPNDGIQPTQLFALRGEVEAANTRKLHILPGEKRRYIASDTGEEHHKKKLSNNCIAPQELELKLNAQVMLIKNLDTNLVNGSLGKVTAFDKETGYPVVTFSNIGGNAREYLTITVAPESWKMELPGLGEVATRTQVPLILAWAISIHKSQGQTLPRVVVDLAKVFEKGQAYVALSRATGLEGLQVLNFDKRRIMAHPKVVEFYSSLARR